MKKHEFSIGDLLTWEKTKYGPGPVEMIMKIRKQTICCSCPMRFPWTYVPHYDISMLGSYIRDKLCVHKKVKKDEII